MKSDQHLESLVASYIEGRYDADEFATLEARLLEDAECRRYFLDTVLLDQDLCMLGGLRPAKPGAGPVPVEIMLQRQRKHAVRTSLLAAAAVILITTVVLWLQMVPAQPATLAGFRAAPNSAFILTHASDGEEPMGNVLNEGSRLVIEHGVVELGLPHGVRGVVEAPAAMTLLDERTLQVDRGRAYFEVSSPEGRGFTVVTPHQRFVDLGTAFGVDAGKDRIGTELHVFKGKIRVDSPDGTKGEIIEATRSVLLEGTRVEKNLDSAPDVFLKRLPRKVTTVLQDDFESGLVGGRSYAVIIDPGTVRDLSGNRFAGIEESKAWNFSTSSVVECPAAFHDFGGEPSRGHITTQRSLDETVRLINLADGADTGIELRIERSGMIDLRQGGATRPPAAGTPAAALFLDSGIDLDDGFFTSSQRQNGGAATVHLSGLRPELRYDVALYGDRDSAADGKERFSLQGAEAAANRSSGGIVDPFVTEIETRPNAETGHVVRWTGIAPGGDGSIVIKIDPSISREDNIAYLCALRLAATTNEGTPVGFAGQPFDSSGHADADGLPDAFEFEHTTPPSATAMDPRADSEGDGSGDGLNNLQEFLYGTNPNHPDSDGDGVPDGAEIAAGTDPTSAPAFDEPDGLQRPERDTAPPIVVRRYPAMDSFQAMQGESLTLTFNEGIRLGTGRIFLRNVTDWSESIITVGDPGVSVDGRVLTITPNADLKDGEVKMGRVCGWESDGSVGILNPLGNGRWYQNEGMADDSRSRGVVDPMRGPTMVTLEPRRADSRIKRTFAVIAPDSRYTVSAAIGVRDSANWPADAFLGYSIRLISGDTVLAEISASSPPGPPNTLTMVGFAWDANLLPEGVLPGDPLAIEARTNRASVGNPGYLDIDNIRITVLERLE